MGTPGILSRHAGKGSLLSSLEAEMGLLWMWGELSCFLSSGDGYVGELLELHCLDFQAEDRFTPRWHVGQPCGKASWESLQGKPQIP